MDVTITNAGGRIEIIDLRNDLTNNYDVLKDGLRLFNLGDIVRITFINRRNIEINYNEVELINGATSILPRDGSEFLYELNILLGDFGGGAGSVGTLQEVTDLGNTTDNDISFTNAGLLFDNGAKFKKGTTDSGLGGAKGVAQICSIDYELKWEAGRLYVMEQNGFTIREVRYTFTSIPNVNDDFTKGFVVGSRWVLDNGNLYNCTDSTTGAAVWALETLGGGDMYKSVYDTDNDGVVDKAETVQIIVRNSTGATLTKGQIVYLSGATGNRPNAVLAQANAEATSSKTIGWVFANIGNNSDGYVCVSGSQHDLNTSSFTAGDALWLSATVAGGITATLPVQPNHAVFIGYCARSHPTQGRIVFKIQNGYELQELHNVLITSVANNEGLFYDNSTSLWKNKTIATVLGFTPVTNARSIGTISPLSGGGDLTADRNISIQVANTSQGGYLNNTDWNTFNGKQSAINLTTLGTSGAATFVSNTINIPQYASGGAGALYKSTVDTAGFLSIVNTAVYTQLIPANTYGIGDILRVTYRSRKTGTAGIQIMRIYVNTTADLLGSPIFVGQYRGSAVNTILQMIRHLSIKSSTANTEVLSSATTGAPTDFAQDVPSTLVIDWTAAKYFVFALQNASALDTNYGSMFLIEKL